MGDKKKAAKKKAAKQKAGDVHADRGADDRAFLQRYRLEDFPRPSVTVDIVALTVLDGGLKVALYTRTAPPAVGQLALPGGFVGIDEGLDDAARRLLADKAGLRDVFLEQLYTFGEPQRDLRGRIISVAYVALVDAVRFEDSADGRGRRWRIDVPWPGETGGEVDVVDDNGEVQQLAFDHASILGAAVKRLRGKLDYTPVGFQLLPTEFTLRQLQDVHESVRGEGVNKDSFRRRMLASGHLEATGNHERNVTWRPAELYRFIRRSAV